MVMVAVNPAYRAQLGYVLRQSRAAGLFYAGSYRDFAVTPVVDNVVVPQLLEFKKAVSCSYGETFLESGDPRQELPRTTACLPPNARGPAAEAWPIRLWRLSDDR
ncbi:hypothetical protein [Actinacidiphila oryziradicis]|uniref:Uncharacterized protein n=1 Tax=Actinacidiphila oryziradicis TaxID=2571141 RepID=A0A4U0S8P4_9ACTN|nr:hypothetical protein [Actinacidiphila oryziradicis]TKA04963.1 hypothetical protein FCI23_33170 [Actinacidiphila oryziradicis]